MPMTHKLKGNAFPLRRQYGSGTRKDNNFIFIRMSYSRYFSIREMSYFSIDRKAYSTTRAEKILGYLRTSMLWLWNRGCNIIYTTQTKGRISYLNHRSYSSTSTNDYYGYWDRLQSGIDCVRWKTVYPGSIYASTSL